MYCGDDLGKEIHDLSTIIYIINIGVSQKNYRKYEIRREIFEKDFDDSHILHICIFIATAPNLYAFTKANTAQKVFR